MARIVVFVNFEPDDLESSGIIHPYSCECAGCRVMRSSLLGYFTQAVCAVQDGNGSVVSHPVAGFGIALGPPGLTNEVGTGLARRDSDSTPQGSAYYADNGAADPGLGGFTVGWTVDHEAGSPTLRAHILKEPANASEPRPCRFFNGAACHEACRWHEESRDGNPCIWDQQIKRATGN